MFKIRPLTTYEESILRQAREIKAERRKALAKVLFDWVGPFAGFMLIALIVVGLLRIFGVVHTWALWLALAIFVTAFVVMIVVGIVAGPDEIDEAEAKENPVPAG